MVQNMRVTGQVSDGNEDDEEKVLPKYLIDVDGAETAGRSIPMLIASRRCYLCQQADEDAPTDADPQQFIDRITEHCAAERDYLLADTPLKEAIFRVLLANGNEPMDAEEISVVLTDKWAMTPFPRNTAADVIVKMADNSRNYCIARVPEPEPEIVAVEEVPEPEVDTAADQAEAEKPEESSEKQAEAE
jgi:hypothetical protein